MSLLDQIGKSISESTVGRIRWHSNMWAVIGSQWDKHRVQNKNLVVLGSRPGSENPRVNANGEFEYDGRTLVRKPNTACPNPPGPDFWFDGKWHWVPAVACRRCQYH